MGEEKVYVIAESDLKKVMSVMSKFKYADVHIAMYILENLAELSIKDAPEEEQKDPELIEG